MTIAYLTDDEVNAAFATRIATKAGASFFVMNANDCIGTLAADFLVIDLDHLPAEYKVQLLDEAARGSISLAIAVHSAELTDNEVDTLVNVGISVEREVTAAVQIALHACQPRPGETK